MNSLDKSKLINSDHQDLFSRALILIANYSWYVSKDMRINEIVKLFKFAFEKNEVELNAYFLDYFSINMLDNINELSIKYPERSKMFHEAYNAHNKGLYHCSTLLWLTLSDGICNGKFFKIRKNKKALKLWLNQIGTPDSLIKILKVISQENAIDVFSDNTAQYPSQLNRHVIIHGFDSNYGNEINSLKAFSLLVFLKDMINRKM